MRSTQSFSLEARTFRVNRSAIPGDSEIFTSSTSRATKSGSGKPLSKPGAVHPHA
jgi:hypothetical protein